MSRCNYFEEKNNCYNSNDKCDKCDVDNKPCICPPGPQCPMGARGPKGPKGEQGEVGPVGPASPAGGILNYADFYALMPPDNSATITQVPTQAFPNTVLTAVPVLRDRALIPLR